MAITLNGTTGITTPDINSTAGFDAADITGTIGSAQIADANVTQAKLAGEAVNESKLQVSNAPTNGYMLTAESGNTGGLTWAAAPTSSTTTGAVGTYALLTENTVFLADQGSTKAGSNLNYSSTGGSYYSLTSPSGTWRCMGYADSIAFSTRSTTVWVRIS
jgi:hypothetical protein